MTIPANSNKYSKLTYYQTRKKYTCDLYHVTDWGGSVTETKKGSGSVYEPKDVYLKVYYKE